MENTTIMKILLTKYYHKHFAEIITSILFLLVVNILLLIFGIFSSRKQRSENYKIQTEKIDSTNLMLKNATNLEEVLKKYKK